MMTFFVITVLAIFYMASTLNQIKPLSVYLTKYDRLQLLPVYSFFAPAPLSSDFRLVYKVDENEDAEWEELDMYKEFDLKRIFWNPFKYYNKGMIDSCQILSQEYAIIKDKEKIRASTYHINIVLSIYRYLTLTNRPVHALKFAIVTSEGSENLKINGIIFDSTYQKI